MDLRRGNGDRAVDCCPAGLGEPGTFHGYGINDDADIAPRDQVGDIAASRMGLPSDEPPIPADEIREPMGEFSEYLVAAYGKEKARAMVRSWANAARGLIGRGGDIARARVADIHCPVLLIVGDGDMLVPVPLATDFANRLPNGEIRVVPGVGHDVQFQRPEWLASTLSEFLGRH